MADFDVVVLGGGSAAESTCTSDLGGLSVAVIEESRFGGFCPFVACMPSKSMLRSAALRHLTVRADESGFGAGDAPHGDSVAAYRMAAERRNQIVESLDDTAHEKELRQRGISTIRGRGTVIGRGTVEVNGETVRGEHLVIATGSELQPPYLPGLESVDWWSSERLLTSSDLPGSVLLVGGGPVGCELAQVLARFGCQVILAESSERLLLGEEPDLGWAVRRILESDGVEVLSDTDLEVVAGRSGGGLIARTADRQVEAEVLLIATGRRPRLRDLGLEQAYGMEANAQALPVDGMCRALGQDTLWGMGDVTGVAPFTHTASYQGRLVAANLRGEHLEADYRAIPRCVYLDPAAAAVGLTTDQAGEQGLKVRVGRADLRECARALVDGADTGFLELVEDFNKGELIGASAVGPGAEEWIGWAVLAIRARLPIRLLAQAVAPFPTYLELYRVAAGRLAVPV